MQQPQFVALSAWAFLIACLCSSAALMHTLPQVHSKLGLHGRPHSPRQKHGARCSDSQQATAASLKWLHFAGVLGMCSITILESPHRLCSHDNPRRTVVSIPQCLGTTHGHNVRPCMAHALTPMCMHHSVLSSAKTTSTPLSHKQAAP